MKGLYLLLGLPILLAPTPVFAAVAPIDIVVLTSNTFAMITLIAISASGFFLVRGGYLYITSSGKPEVLEQAKITIRNALIGLVITLSAGLIANMLKTALIPVVEKTVESHAYLPEIVTVKPSDGLTQVLIDAVSGFVQNLVESATKPVVDGIISFLTATPSLFGNSVIRKFWFVSLGITDSLFVVVIALIGLQVMSANTFGFEELELSQILPRIGLAFLGANVSLFLADYIITICNVLINTILEATGGFNHIWFANVSHPVALVTGSTPFIILTFLLLFLIVATVLLFMYISRLILISVGAVLSPFVFLLWALPKFADTAEIAAKTYIAGVFTIFVHVVIIQLAASYLIIPENSNNSLLSTAAGIGLLLTLLKTPSFLMSLAMSNVHMSSLKKLGLQIINVMTSSSVSPTSVKRASRQLRKGNQL